MYAVEDGAVEDGFEDLGLLIRMHAVLPQPDLFILLDVLADEALKRLEARAREKDRYELMPSEALDKRIERYSFLWEMMNVYDSKRWVKVDVNAPKEVVSERIWDVVSPVLWR